MGHLKEIHAPVQSMTWVGGSRSMFGHGTKPTSERTKCIAHLPLLSLLNHNCIIFSFDISDQYGRCSAESTKTTTNHQTTEGIIKAYKGGSNEATGFTYAGYPEKETHCYTK